MKRTTLTFFLAVLFSLVQHQQVDADVIKRGNNAIRSLRGFLADIHYGHKMITVEDEFSRLTRTFYVPWKRIDHLKVGDEIRVYYYPGKREALSVQKMTPVIYRKEDQNEGYLLRTKQRND